MVIQTECRAKINLYMCVTGKRPDGFHDLVTLFREIDLADQLSWTPADGPLTLAVHGAELGDPEQNLVIKAARRFGELTGHYPGGAITLEKSIPAGGGLGGGSSDAAGMIRLLNRHFGDPLDAEAIAALCAALGSDVPFFLDGGCQIGTGRGIALKAAPEPRNCPQQGFLLLPPLPLSTAAVFRACRSGSPAPPEVGRNDLLPAALETSEPFARIWRKLERHFPPPFFMTGSGTLVWLTPNQEIDKGQRNLLKSMGVGFVPFRFW